MCRLALGGQTAKNVRRLANEEFELEQSRLKSMQVGGQTKRMLDASRKRALTSVRPGLYVQRDPYWSFETRDIFWRAFLTFKCGRNDLWSETFHDTQPWPNGLASRRKFPKPELAYGLAMGGQTDSSARKFTQVAQSRKFHAYTDGLRPIKDIRAKIF